MLRGLAPCDDYAQISLTEQEGSSKTGLEPPIYEIALPDCGVVRLYQCVKENTLRRASYPEPPGPRYLFHGAPWCRYVSPRLCELYWRAADELISVHPSGILKSIEDGKGWIFSRLDIKPVVYAVDEYE